MSTREPLPDNLFDPGCPSSLSPIRVGDKWSGMVLVCLRDGPRRFSELRVPLRRVTAKVLTETLRAMERDGLISRTVHAGVPQRVEYALTPLGHSLFAALDLCRQWAGEHLAELAAARETYDARRPAIDGVS